MEVIEMADTNVFQREGTLLGGAHPSSSLTFGEVMADALQARGFDRNEDPQAYQEAANAYVEQFLRPKKTQET